MRHESRQMTTGRTGPGLAAIRAGFNAASRADFIAASNAALIAVVRTAVGSNAHARGGERR